MSSFKTSSEIFASPFALPQSWSFDNYVNAWTTAGIGSFFFNSVIVVFGALILTMLFGSMSAYVLARFTFPGSRALYYLMLAGLTFPIFLAIVPLFFVLRGIGLLNTLPGSDLDLRGVRVPVHGVLPLSPSSGRCRSRSPRRPRSMVRGSGGPSSRSCCRWRSRVWPRLRS